MTNEEKGKLRSSLMEYTHKAKLDPVAVQYWLNSINDLNPGRGAEMSRILDAADIEEHNHMKKLDNGIANH